MIEIFDITERLETNIWWMKYVDNDPDKYICTENFRNTHINPWLSGSNDSNILMEGPSGTGKTYLAKIIGNNTGSKIIKSINCSSNNGVGVIRQDVFDFVSTRSPTGGRKTILLDEIERLSLDAVKAVLGTIDDFSSRCRFIATCNNYSALTDIDVRSAFKSRFQWVNFSDIHGNSPEERKKLIKDVYSHCKYILNNENVEFEKEALIAIIKDNFFNGYVNFRDIIQKIYEYNGRVLTLEQYIDDKATTDYLLTLITTKESHVKNHKEICGIIKRSPNKCFSILDDLSVNAVDFFKFEDFDGAINDICDCKMNLHRDPQNPIVAFNAFLCNIRDKLHG